MNCNDNDVKDVNYLIELTNDNNEDGINQNHLKTIDPKKDKEDLKEINKKSINIQKFNRFYAAIDCKEDQVIKTGSN